MMLNYTAQSPGVIEYTDYISNELPKYDAKPSWW